jgi:soluble lytic murein transglycosylase-like protein
LAICTHESGLTNVYVPDDHGTPTIGICQIKRDTARYMGFKGTQKDLLNPYTNAIVAAQYLGYQLRRYNNNWIKATAAYNAGRYNENHVTNQPRNMKYVRLVRQHLPRELLGRLMAANEGGTK